VDLLKARKKIAARKNQYIIGVLLIVFDFYSMFFSSFDIIATELLAAYFTFSVVFSRMLFFLIFVSGIAIAIINRPIDWKFSFFYSHQHSTLYILAQQEMV